jgi:hypothetical protein
MTGGTVGLGLLTLAWPVAWGPAWAYPVAILGAVAVLAAAFARWRRGPALAVAAAIITCAASGAGLAVLAAEGLFILGYLLAADAPAGLLRPVQWLRGQVLVLVAGLIASGAVLAAFAVHPSDSAWITCVGLAAAVAAYLVALPRRGQGSGASAGSRRKPGT